MLKQREGIGRRPFVPHPQSCYSARAREPKSLSFEIQHSETLRGRRQNHFSVSYLPPWRLPREEQTAAEGPRAGNPPHRRRTSASAHPRPPTVAPVSHSWIFSSISLCGRGRRSVGLSPLEPRIEAPPRRLRPSASRGCAACTHHLPFLAPSHSLALTTRRGCIIPTLETSQNFTFRACPTRKILFGKVLQGIH